MTRYEHEKLLKLKGTSVRAQNFVYISQHIEGTLSSSLWWHARYGHINYDSLLLLKKNSVFGFPTIPKKLLQCDACILGKHSKQTFHDTNYRACRELEMIHSYLCDTMPIISANGNIHVMNFIDDYTKMCWVYLLKDKYQTFEHLITFMYGLKMRHNF